MRTRSMFQLPEIWPWLRPPSIAGEVRPMCAHLWQAIGGALSARHGAVPRRQRLALRVYGHVFSACLMTLRAASAATAPRLLPASCEAVQLLQNTGRSLTKSPNS